MKARSEEDVNKVQRLIDFLTELASLRQKTVRDLADYDRVVWLSEIPHQRGCATQAWGRNEELPADIWAEVQTRPEPALPELPDECKDWVDPKALPDADEEPPLKKTVTRTIPNPHYVPGGSEPQLVVEVLALEDHPAVERAWSSYLRGRWEPWAEQHLRWKEVHSVYSQFFAVHQEQVRLGEEYELVLGLGLLRWRTPSGQTIRRHMVVADASLEFEARLGKFTVRPHSDGAKLRPELDMLDVEERPGRAEETAKEGLSRASDDPWETQHLEGVLQGLVHSISASGEFRKQLRPSSSTTGEKPILDYAPALILRKRSLRGLTDVLWRIRNRIEEGGEIPSEFADLAEIADGDDGDGNGESAKPEVIYFPKPANDEQRQIIRKLSSASGVLVQGPPGTGKSHTIANLICHLLATGQRTLVTAKTPRALQVLKNLIPEELQPLCISLLGKGQDEKRSLESSVSAILQENAQWDERRNRSQIEREEEALAALREEKASNENRLRAVRESETHTQSVADGAYRGTAAQKVRSEIAQAESSLHSVCGSERAHPVVWELIQAVRDRDGESYSSGYQTVAEVRRNREAVEDANERLAAVREHAPNMAKDLNDPGDVSEWRQRLASLPAAWAWARAKNWLDDYIHGEDADSLARRQRQIEDEVGSHIARLASLRGWMFCFSRMKEEHRRQMEAWRLAMRRLGKGTGKHAPRYRREAQEHLNKCREAVPAWVMPLHRVWDTVDPMPGTFDVVIVDEASQCGFEAFPLFYLAKKILIVGDDEQISPEAVGISGDAVNQLAKKFLWDFGLSSTFNERSSLFAQGRIRYGTSRIALREHFRCVPEIIKFSNDLCYSDAPLIPLRQYEPDRIVPALAHVYLENGYREGQYSRVINRPEAKAVADKVVELCGDARYDGKTMGVVVLQGEAQAGLIEEQLLQRLGATEMEERRLVCGNPYSFQGDERDIMILSMVAATNQRIGVLSSDADRRRFNVAASRARDQMWLFHSVTCADLSDLCLRRRLIEFFESPAPPPIAGINQQQLRLTSQQANRSIEKPPPPFDSWFEVDVALEIAGKGYRVLPQFEVAGKRIDLVIEGGHARLAVECDGDHWHGIDEYEEDMQRQRMLERCGWVFFRVRSSAFYGNWEVALRGLWRMLAEREIHPEGDGPAPAPESAGLPPEDESTTDLIVGIGDSVVYVNAEDSEETRQVTISKGASEPEYGIVNAETPIAQALLGARLDEVVVAHLPIGPARLRILEVKKG